MLLSQRLIGLVLLGLAATVWAVTLGWPRIPGQDLGPGQFPRAVALGLGIAGAVYLARGLLEQPRPKLATRAGWMRETRAPLSVALTLGAILLYLVASPYTGFVVACFALLLGLMLFLRTRPWIALAASTGTTLGIEYAFAVLLRVPLPRGWLTLLA